MMKDDSIRHALKHLQSMELQEMDTQIAYLHARIIVADMYEDQVRDIANMLRHRSGRGNFTVDDVRKSMVGKIRMVL